MMMPLFGQLTRSWWSVVSAVMWSPHFGCVFAASAPLSAMTPATAKANITASETSVAGAAWRRSSVGIPVLPCPAAQEVARVQAKLHPPAAERKLRFDPWRSWPPPALLPRPAAGIGAGGDRAAPWSRLLERDRVHRLRDLVDDQVGELGSLPAVEPLHRGDHPHHQQRDEQDQADVFDRPLPALALERGDDPAGTAQELRLDVCGQPCEHGCLPGRFADRPGHGHTGPDADVSPYRRIGGERRVTLGESRCERGGEPTTRDDDEYAALWTRSADRRRGDRARSRARGPRGNGPGSRGRRLHRGRRPVPDPLRSRSEAWRLPVVQGPAADASSAPQDRAMGLSLGRRRGDQGPVSLGGDG